MTNPRKLVLQATVLALIILGCILLATPSRAADLSQTVHIAAGVNGAWLDGPGAAFPADFEAGGTAWASLSPHISAFADTYYGFSHSYVRWDGGAKVTASDVDNPNFSIYLSAKYRGGSTADLQPNEWAAGAGLGWKPNPAAWPRVIVGVDAAYGLQSNRVLAYLALRYTIPLK